MRIKGDTETRKSRRVLKLPTKAVQALRAHHARQAAERLAAGKAWQDHDLVFCHEDGTPLDRWHVRKEFQKIKGREARRGMDAPGTAALVRVHPERSRCPAGGHQRPGRAQQHVSTETVYRHEIRPALTKGATAMNRILKAKAAKPA